MNSGIVFITGTFQTQPNHRLICPECPGILSSFTSPPWESYPFPHNCHLHRQPPRNKNPNVPVSIHPCNRINLGTFQRTEIRHLRGLRELHLRWLPRRARLPPGRRGDLRRLGRRLRQAGRLLRPPEGHGPRLPRVRLPPEPDGEADDLLVQLARVPDIRGDAAELHLDHRALQHVEELRRHPGLVGKRGEHHRLLREQPGRDRAERGTRPLERPGHGESLSDYVLRRNGASNRRGARTPLPTAVCRRSCQPPAYPPEIQSRARTYTQCNLHVSQLYHLL